MYVAHHIYGRHRTLDGCNRKLQKKQKKTGYARIAQEKSFAPYGKPHCHKADGRLYRDRHDADMNIVYRQMSIAQVANP